MTPPQLVRRRYDGSIDLDFYRTRAVAFRRQAMRDSAALKLAGVGISLIAVVFPLVLALAAIPTRQTTPAVVAFREAAPPTTMEQAQ